LKTFCKDPDITELSTGAKAPPVESEKRSGDEIESEDGTTPPSLNLKPLLNLNLLGERTDLRVGKRTKLVSAPDLFIEGVGPSRSVGGLKLDEFLSCHVPESSVGFMFSFNAD
tara:strand:+ start:2918 stop:3256 length:339 start_codon:yes stop_codon:yes gene_type:complete